MDDAIQTAKKTTRIQRELIAASHDDFPGEE
jgi:hypothetical protein